MGRKRPLLQIRHKKCPHVLYSFADPQLPQFDMSKSPNKNEFSCEGVGGGLGKKNTLQEGLTQQETHADSPAWGPNVKYTYMPTFLPIKTFLNIC